MIQRWHRPCLALESTDKIQVVQQIGREELESDATSEDEIIHLAHPPSARCSPTSLADNGFGQYAKSPSVCILVAADSNAPLTR